MILFHVRIDELFEEQVERNPDAIAVRFEGAQMTYRALDARANQIAHRLQSLGVGPDVLVPIVIERSLDMLPALLGILKAGGAYVPLDPSYPAERIAFMLADIAPRVIVTQAQFVERIPSGPWEVVQIDATTNAPTARPSHRGTSRDLAYGIYTSGSTGTPKCALVTHESLANVLGEERLDASARFVQNTPLTFDPSVLELFGPVTAGGCLVVPRPGGHRDLGYLLDLIRREQVTSVTFVPSLLEIVVEEPALADCRSLRRVLVGGERLSYDLQQRFFARSNAELHNAYGPTEATVYSSIWRCRRDGTDRTVPIGRAIAHTKLVVLDPQQQPVPLGEPGELYIGGLGVARGYLNRPELTAERFVVVGGERLYRTGDVARYRTDGTLEFLGRTDDQVKIRGFRVELGEIDACLREHVDDVAVLVRDQQLIAYVVPETVDAAALREVVGARLPDYMIPARFVTMRAFPLLESGKVDRNALPAPVWPRASARVQTPTQALVAEIWRTVLEVDDVGADDDFFARGGHSLLAIQVLARVRGMTGVDVAMRAFFDAPTVRALAALIDAGSQAPADVIEHIPGDVRLSSSQEQLWFLHALDPASVAYVVPLVLRLRGPLDAAALASSLDKIVRRHDVLRATIAGDIPHMKVAAHEPRVLHAEWVASFAEAEAIAHAEARAPFDLERGPLFRARLLRIAGDDHVLAITMHHVVADGWSCNVIERELLDLHARRSLPEPAIQFSDYARWERTHTGGADALAFWKAHLAGVPLVLEMPADRARPPVQTFAGARRRFVLNAQTVDAIAKLSRSEGVTPFMTLFAVFGVLLHRYTGQEQLVIGVPIAHRGRAEIEHLVGMFVNTLAFATDVTGNPTFRELVQRVRATTLAGFAHQDLPFNKLVEELQPARDLGRTPIAQAMFAYQTAGVHARADEGLTITRMPIDNGTSKFELMIDLTPVGAELAGFVEYNTDLYDAATIERFVQHFERLVDAFVADPSARVSEIRMLTHAERHELAAWNATARDVPDRRLEQLFEDQVARTPDAVAVRFEDAQLTYRELDVRANQLAHRLRALGVDHEKLVPIFVERSLEMLPGLLGILKADGAYVPLDPEYPAERLAFMLEDCAPRVVVTQRRLRDRLPAGPWHVLELDTIDGPTDRPSRTGTSTSLAYGIYTSGSTGKPKCALVEHRSVVNLLLEETYRLDATDRVLQKTPLTFDASVPELFGPLRVGARLVVARPDGHRDVAYLFDVIRAEQITSVTFVPSLLDVFAGEPELARCASLRRVLVGGEALSFDVVARFFARTHAELHNTYGPTETTVTSAYWPCRRDVDTIPIGRPVGNTQLHVLDARQQPVPIGVLGELYIAGIGLARGYLNRPELTAERFVVVDGERMYRTGDVVRHRADGNLEFLGRTDHQVKVRGFRIELGEIEASLRTHVRDVVVLAREDVPGQKHLVAYVVGAASEDELREVLRSKLPDYMVPSAFVFLDALPLMVNGKVDRKALPAPARAARALVAPRTAIEETIAAIWCEVLGLDEVGVTDDFFSLGGHSLLAMQVVAKIRHAFEIDVPLRMLLQARTIEDQARLVTRKAEHLGRLIMRTDTPIARATIAQEQFYFLSQDDPDPAAYFTRSVLAIEGPLDRALLERSYTELVGYHGIFRTGFREIDGRLHQVVFPDPPAPSFSVAEGEEIEHAVAELLKLPCDLARGLGLIRARLIAVAPERHVLVVLTHHIASDGTVFLEQLFDRYSGASAPDGLQYIDFAHALARWSETPTAKTHRAYWDDRVRDAPPLALPTDASRAAIDARRDARTFGIAADLNYPPDYKRLPDEVRSRVIEAARALKTTPYMIYLGALAWLFHEAGNETVSIQTTYNHRPEYPVLEQVQGPFAWWTHVRIDASKRPTFAELVRRTSLAVDGARENGVIEDYFQRVPHPIRRSAFNYLPMAALPEIHATDLRIARLSQPFPTWKRHWDLHLTLLDFASETVLVWTGVEALFGQKTVRGLLDRYIAILGRADR